MPKAPVADVPGVEVQAAVEADVAAAADLPEAGDAGGRHADDGQIPANLLFLARQVRARADKAHLPFQHVEDLRQFIEAVFTDEFADMRDARIVAAEFLELLPLLLGLGVFTEEVEQDAVGIHVHRTEFIAFERLAAIADARNIVKRRAVRVQLDQNGQHEQQR